MDVTRDELVALREAKDHVKSVLQSIEAGNPPTLQILREVINSCEFLKSEGSETDYNEYSHIKSRLLFASEFGVVRPNI